MAIAFVNANSNSSDFTATVSCTLDAGTDDNRCVIAFAVTDRSGATTINSATYNGVAMTAHTAFTSGSVGADGRLFYLAGAASGSNTVQITLSDSNTKPKVVALAYSGVDQTTPVENLSNYGPAAATTAPSQTVTSESGDLVAFLFTVFGSGTTLTASSPANERIDAAAGNNRMFAMDEAGDTSVTIDGTLSASSEVWGTAFNINAAAAAGSMSKTNRMLMGVG